MAAVDKEPDPLRRRAGLLSALTRTYNEAYRLMKNRGTSEEVEQLRAKIEDRYTAYLESHEVTLVEYPDREQTLVESHAAYDLKHQLLLDNLAAYLEKGETYEDIISHYAASLFSGRSSAKNSAAKSCPVFRDKASRVSQARSVTALSETRVKAALAKKQFEQQQAEQLAAQRKIEFDRDVARQHRELDKRKKEAEMRQRQLQEEAAARQRQQQEEAAARERQLQDEAAARQQQLQEETDRQMRELEERQRELREEAELHQRELENAQ